MQPGMRVGLGIAAAVGAGLVLVTCFSEGWYHAPYNSTYLAEEIDWSGFGGPSTMHDESTLGRITGIIAGLSAMSAALCAAIASFGTLAGARRDHVPRLPALLAAMFAPLSIFMQTVAMSTWPYAEQPEPRGFGWAMPVFFAAALTLSIATAALTVDARRRARASAEALAKIEREQRQADLAGMPELQAEEPPVERL